MIKMIDVNGIALSDEAARECETSAATEFAREWLNAMEIKRNDNLVVPVFFRRQTAEENSCEDRSIPNPDYVPICSLTKNKPTGP